MNNRWKYYNYALVLNVVPHKDVNISLLSNKEIRKRGRGLIDNIFSVLQVKLLLRGNDE